MTSSALGVADAMGRRKSKPSPGYRRRGGEGGGSVLDDDDSPPENCGGVALAIS